MTATVCAASGASARPKRPRASDSIASVRVELSEPATAADGVRTMLPLAPAAIGAGFVSARDASEDVAVTRRSSWKSGSEATTLVTARLRVTAEPARMLPSESVEATFGRAYS